MFNKLAKSIVVFCTLILASCTTPTNTVSMEKVFIGNEYETQLIGQGISVNTLGIKPRFDDINLLWNLKNITGVRKEFSAKAGAFDVVGDSIFILTDTGRISVIHIETHESFWENQLDITDTLRFNGYIKFINGKVIVATGSNILGYDATTGKLKWKRELVVSIGSRITSHGNLALMQVSDERVIAINVIDGTIKWTHSGTPSDITFVENSPVVVYKNIAFVLYPLGEIFALDVNTGTEIWGRALNGEIYTALVGEVNGFISKPYIKNNKIFILSGSNSIIAIDIYNGKTIWRKNKSGNVDIIGVGDVIFVIDNDSKISAINTNIGSVYWTLKLQNIPNSTKTGFNSVVYHNGKLILFGKSGKIQVVGIDTGQTIAVHKAIPINGVPLIKAGKVIILDDNGNLKAYR